METFSCPRRQWDFGIMADPLGKDWWSADKWNARDDMWSWPWKPRACSFCGGIHPEDAIELHQEGWLIIKTDKAYKRYLEPPTNWYPVPPVQVYSYHFDASQMGWFQ